MKSHFEQTECETDFILTRESPLKLFVDPFYRRTEVWSDTCEMPDSNKNHARTATDQSPATLNDEAHLQQKGITTGILVPVVFLMVSSFFSGCDIFGTAVDERAPRLSIIRPFDETLVSGKNVLIAVSAEALGEGNWISFVNINVNGVLAGEAISDGTNFKLRINTFDYPDGLYRVEAIAFDRYQARGISAPVLMTINNESDGPGPIMSITDPTENDEVSGVTRIVARTDVGEPFVTRVDLLIDGVPVLTETDPIGGNTFIFDYDVASLGLGEHILEVKACSGPTVFRISESVSVTIRIDDGGVLGSPGSIRWKTPGIQGDVDSAPAVGFNNDIYIGTTEGES